MKYCFAFLLFFQSCSVAGLIVDIPLGFSASEDGLVGRSGFTANANFAGADADLVAGSLRYIDSAGNALNATGSTILVDSHEEAGTVSNIRPLSLASVTGNTLWLSFVGKQANGGTDHFFGLSLRGPDNTIQPPDTGTGMDEFLSIGMPSGTLLTQDIVKQWRIWDRSTNGAGWNYALSTTPTTGMTFVLVKIELNADGVKERYTMWTNPRLDQAPDPAAGVSFVSSDSDFSAWSQITELRVAAGWNVDPQLASAWMVDEIRISETMAEVMPFTRFEITNVTPGPNGGISLTWRAGANMTEAVQWSTNLIDWFTYNDSIRTNPNSSALATWETPPMGATARFHRVIRLPAP